MSLHPSPHTPRNQKPYTLLDSRSQTPCWEYFTQQAKAGVRGYGHCPAEAFSQIALALMAVITDPHCIQASETFVLECRAPDTEQLLHDFLNAFCKEITAREIVCCAVDVNINGHHLYATFWGETVNPLRHVITLKPKAFGYSDVHVECLDQDCWLAKCVIDTV